MEASGISQLLVLHRPKDAAGHGMSPAHQAQLMQHGFFLDTCLRQLVVIDAAHVDDFFANQIGAADPQIESYLGVNACSFLLQTATGLNSSIPGETNILGQFKHTWSRWREQAAPEKVCRLHATIHRLFADSRQIRLDYLQGIGGNSYGSLVRKILKPDADSRLLFVGAGKLAHSMLPLFNNLDMGIWNHQPVNKPSIDSCRLFSVSASQQAASWATHVVLTTPAESHNDQLWAELTDLHLPRIVHLGRRRAEPGIWSTRTGSDNYFDLDDIFDLRSKQSSLRTLQIRRARKACEQLAAANGATHSTYLPQSALA
jgi:hypothetical protein